MAPCSLSSDIKDSRSPEIPTWLEKNFIYTTTRDQARVPASDGQHANNFSLAAS